MSPNVLRLVHPINPAWTEAAVRGEDGLCLDTYAIQDRFEGKSLLLAISHTALEGAWRRVPGVEAGIRELTRCKPLSVGDKLPTTQFCRFARLNRVFKGDNSVQFRPTPFRQSHQKGQGQRVESYWSTRSNSGKAQPSASFHYLISLLMLDCVTRIIGGGPRASLHGTGGKGDKGPPL